MTFNNLIRIPNINDTPGFYYVYNISTPKINGIYVKSTQDSPAIKLGELSMWEDVIQNNLGVNILYNYYF